MLLRITLPEGKVVKRTKDFIYINVDGHVDWINGGCVATVDCQTPKEFESPDRKARSVKSILVNRKGRIALE